MTTVEVLKAARELIATPDRWTKSAGARTSKSHPIYVSAPNAVCWCAWGACHRVMGVSAAADCAVDALVRVLGLDPEEDGVAEFNDAPTTTHADVLALFDRAINAEENK